MSKVKYIFIVAIIITNLNAISFANEVSTEVLNERIESVDKFVNEKIENTKKKVQENSDLIQSNEEIILINKGEIKDIKKWLFSILGISVTGIIYLFININKTLEKKLDEKDKLLKEMVAAYSEENMIRKEIKALVFDKQIDTDLKDVLRKFFTGTGLNYRNLTQKNEILQKLNNDDDLKNLINNVDIIIFGSEVEAVEEITNKINQINNDVMFLYYNKQVDKRQLNNIVYNFASSKSTVYTNLMDLLKYKRNILN